MSKFLYSWSNIDTYCSIIYSQLLSTNWIPDYIVGVKRGGLIPAIILSHKINKPLMMMSCQLRDSIDKKVKLYEMEEVSIDKKILVVDDICDSGTTLSKIVIEFCANNFDIDNIKTCSLIYNIKQNFIVDYYARIIDREKEKDWLVFPWEINA
jgi:hypoxanthine phosphoribosyltransferase